MPLFGKKTKINDSSAEKAEATKSAIAKAPQKAKPAKAAALPKAEKVAEAAAKAKAAKKSDHDKKAEAAAGVSFAKDSAVISPRITEKAARLAEQGIYAFNVRKDASAHAIVRAIALAYKVTPIRVSTAPIKAKTMVVRGRPGKTSSGKKAYVYLKKGDKIEFV